MKSGWPMWSRRAAMLAVLATMLLVVPRARAANEYTERKKAVRELMSRFAKALIARGACQGTILPAKPQPQPLSDPSSQHQ